MNNLWGHNRIKAWWQAQKNSDLQSAAFIFHGPAHIGKATFANYAAADLLGAPADKLFSHPDFVHLGLTDPEETRLAVDEVRRVISSLKTPAVRAKSRVVILDDAQTLTPEAQNALLKTLEEPRVPTIFFIITNNLESLLPTVLSRCQLISFSPLAATDWPPAEAEILHALPLDLQAILRAAPGLFNLYQTNKKDRAKIEKRLASVRLLLQAPLGQKMTEVKKIAKAADWQELQSTLDYALLVAHGTKAAPATLQSIVEAKAAVQRYVNKTIILDHIVLT